MTSAVNPKLTERQFFQSHGDFVHMVAVVHNSAMEMAVAAYPLVMAIRPILGFARMLGAYFEYDQTVFFT